MPHTIPQPKTSRILGNLSLIDPETPVQSLMKVAGEFGPIFRLAFPGREIIVISSQELVNDACDEGRFDKKVHAPLEKIRDWAGDGLFTAHTEEPNWGAAHRILMPVFGPQALHSMFDSMLDIAEQMLVKWERLGDASLDVADNMTRLTLDTIALCAFDYRFNSFYEREMHPFVGAMVRALAESGARAKRLPIQTRLMLMTQRQYSEDVRQMHQIADEVIGRRRLDPASSEKKDVLSVMLTARDKVTGQGLSDINIRYQLVTFLIAGHETTSGMLTFALHALLSHPEVLRAAYEEVDRVLGGDRPRVEHLARFKYLDQILKETLRLWPTAPAFALTPRHASTILAGKYEISPKDQLLVLLPILHRDPSVWGPDPEKFDPDRMEDSKLEALPPNAWKPFGNGQRACIGRPFAMQEATLVLATLLQRFELEKADPSYQLHIKETLTLKPEGFMIKVKKRAKMASRTPAPPATSKAALAPSSVSSGGGTPLTVLFGSNGGSSEAFARRVASDAQLQGYASTVGSLDSAVGRLPKVGGLIVVTSSYEGQPPDNARAFVNWLDGLSAGELKGVRYAVFGCGNRDWARTYQAIPKRIDSRLADLGSERLRPRGEADAHADFFGDFDRWYGTLWPELGKVFGIEATTTTPAPLFDIEFVESPRDTALKQNGVLLGTVVENRELVDLTSPIGRSKRHIEIALPPGVSYRSGDYLAVMPVNPPENVDRALKRFGLSYDASIVVHMGAGLQTFLPVNQALRVGDLLASQVELSQPATRKNIEVLLTSSQCPPEKEALRGLVAGDEAYKKGVLEKRASVLDLLEEFGSCELPFAAFLQMLQPLRPRQYSISSSSLWSQDHCSVTVAVVQGQAWSGHGTYRGVTSNFLATAKPGTRIGIMPRASNPAFHLPEDHALPLVMVGAGTGLAPFRGFLQERAIRKAQGVPTGEALLFFGCDHPEVDYLYKAELEQWQKDGIVRLRPAFSGQAEGGVKYVQDRIWQDRQEVVEFFKRGARAFVCGDGKRMAPAVRDTFGRIYQEMTQAKPEAVEAFLSELEKTTRYVVDVFA